MSSTNRSERGGGGTDFFETPAWVTTLVLPYVLPPAGLVLDPCGGRGALIRSIPWAAQRATYALEIDPAHREPLAESCGSVCIRDALSPVDWAHPDEGRAPSLVIMNPPFSLAEQFVARALEEVAVGGLVVALLRTAFLESEERYHFHALNPKPDLYFLPNRPGFTSNGRSDSAMYAWFVWERLEQVKLRGGRWFMLPLTPKEIRCPKKPKKEKE